MKQRQKILSALALVIFGTLFLSSNLVNAYPGNLVTPRSTTSAGAGGGAPTDAAYVVTDLNGSLSGEFRVTGTANQVNIATTTDTLTLSLPQSIGTGSSPTFSSVAAGNGTNTSTLSTSALTVSATGASPNGILAVDTNGVTSTGRHFLPPGALATPALTFTADTDTGFFNNANNSITLTLGGGNDYIFTAAGLDVSNSNVSFSANGTCSSSLVGFCRETGAFVWSTGTTGSLRSRINGLNFMIINEASGVSVLTGTTTQHALVGGTLFTTTTAVGNVGTGEDTLNSYTVPALVLTNNSESVSIEGSGTFAASANNKRVRAYFGATAIFDTGVLAVTAAAEWELSCRVFRTGATTQTSKCRWSSDEATFLTDVDLAAPAETLSGTVLTRFTAEATTNNDVTNSTYQVKWDDHGSVN